MIKKLFRALLHNSKPALLIAVLMMAAFSGDAQVKQRYSQYGSIWKRLQADSAMKIPMVIVGIKDGNDGLDTAQIRYDFTDSLVKVWTGSQWRNVGAGAGGSVTSVALNMPSAFSVAGSPITTNGTFAVTGAGTTNQYIRGDGTLGSALPSALIPGIDDVLAKGQLFTNDRDIDLNGRALNILGTGLYINYDNNYTFHQIGSGSGSRFFELSTTGFSVTVNRNPTGSSGFDVYPDSIFLRPYQGKMNINTLRSWTNISDSSRKRIMTWDEVTGNWEYFDGYFPTNGTGGSGEANTASNLGGGLASWDSKSGVDLRFNTFNSSDFDLASNLISIDATLKSNWNDAYSWGDHAGLYWLLSDTASKTWDWNDITGVPSFLTSIPDLQAVTDEGATTTNDIIVPTEAYDATAWNGNFEVPTKDAIRDKIESMSSGGSGTVNAGAANKLAYYPGAGTTVDDISNIEMASGRLEATGNIDGSTLGPIVIKSTGTGNAGTGLVLDGTSDGGRKKLLFTTGSTATGGAGSFALYDLTAGYQMFITTTGEVRLGSGADNDAGAFDFQARGAGWFQYGLTINDDGADSDTRIESDTETDAFLLDATDGSITIGAYGSGSITGTAVYGLGVTAGGKIVETSLAITEGSHTPTTTNSTNITASTAYNTQYIRIGDVVHVFGKVDIDATATGAFEMRMTLPVSNGAFTTDYEGNGTAVCSASGVSVAITSNSGQTTVSFKGIATTTTNDTYSFHYSYKIIYE